MLIAQVCHIEAASSDGPRFNPRMADSQRRSVGNLVVLCYPHHREVDDDEKTFTVSALKQMKLKHEHRVKAFRVRDAAVNRIALEMEQYWEEVDAAKRAHPDPDLAIPIDSTLDGVALFRELRENIEAARKQAHCFADSDYRLRAEVPAFIQMLKGSGRICEDIPTSENPFHNRNWELHSLGTTNIFARISVGLEQLEAKYLEHYLQIKPNDSKALERFAIVKTALKESAASAGLAD